MPRQARLDAPGALHHGMVRGIERRRLVLDHTDRAGVSGRLAALGTATGLTVYARALLPHHAHRLGRMRCGARRT
jgi:putative transposase